MQFKKYPKTFCSKLIVKIDSIQSYPTLIIFRNGKKIEEYSGDRLADAIVDHMMALADPNWAPPPSALVTLTESNFTDYVKKVKLSLVMFYAPWCKHCKQVKPGAHPSSSLSLLKYDF
jgi:thioredoxin-like negative regulator of GroEL